MATLINPTPILDEEEFEQFLRKVEKNVHTPSYRQGNPDRLEMVRQRIIEDAISRKKLLDE